MRCMRYEDCEGFWFGLIRRAGTAMINLASTYSKLGRHADAVAMGKQALDFQRRVLPANHPSIGEGYVGSDAV